MTATGQVRSRAAPAALRVNMPEGVDAALPDALDVRLRKPKLELGQLHESRAVFVDLGHHGVHIA